jgi:hypothetical protein
VGTTVLLVALVDEWVLELRRKRSHESVETRHE